MLRRKPVKWVLVGLVIVAAATFLLAPRVKSWMRKPAPGRVTLIKFVNSPGKGAFHQSELLFRSDGTVRYDGYLEELSPPTDDIDFYLWDRSRKNKPGVFAVSIGRSRFVDLAEKLQAEGFWELSPNYQSGWQDTGSEEIVVETTAGSKIVEGSNPLPDSFEKCVATIEDLVRTIKGWRKISEPAK